jgi:four helix bundle protein
MARGDDIQGRLIEFAASAIGMFKGLPDSEADRHITRQLVRSATAPAALHGEARSAESPADFVHKLKIATKELNESGTWLRILVATGSVTGAAAADLIDECIQLQRILNASIKTARKSTSR